MQNERSLLENNWNFQSISQLIFFLEEESPSNETIVHGAFYDINLAEQYQAELETKTIQRLMDAKSFQTVEEAQAYLLDRDEDYALRYSRFRILSFAEAVEAFGADQVLEFLSENMQRSQDEETSSNRDVLISAIDS